jgi:toxin ParE1/3/4
MRIDWSNQAETDLAKIADYFDQTDTDITDESIAKIYAAPKILLNYSFVGPEIGGRGLRKWLVRETPFILLYRIAPEAIQIVRVAHSTMGWIPES